LKKSILYDNLNNVYLFSCHKNIGGGFQGSATVAFLSRLRNIVRKEQFVCHKWWMLSKKRRYLLNLNMV